jgi:hypothetical protein
MLSAARISYFQESEILRGVQDDRKTIFARASTEINPLLTCAGWQHRFSVILSAAKEPDSSDAALPQNDDFY